MNIENHPCFNPKACKGFGRVHLPVAPRCNIQCNFCNRKFDCVNETRPGVSSCLLSPHQAMDYLKGVFRKKKNISVVGIAGPGDPFANPEETLQTLEMVRNEYPDMLLCVATNGLNLPGYLDEMARLTVSHVSITVNAVDPGIGETIYSWMRFGKKTVSPQTGARLLLERQLESIRGLKERDIIVKVNTIVLPGINDHHVEAIAKTMGRMGVDLFNCMPYYPNKGSNFAHIPEPDPGEINTLRKTARRYVPQMSHCRRCRADAVGNLDEAMDMGLMNHLRACASLEKAPVPTRKPERKYLAVATREGILVNQHLGEARHLYIYNINQGEAVFLERRKAPKPGTSNLRWQDMAQLLNDCRTLLVSGIGTNPRNILTKSGLEIMEVGGLIGDVAFALHNGAPLNHLIKREPVKCGAECSGNAMGCM